MKLESPEHVKDEAGARRNLVQQTEVERVQSPIFLKGGVVVEAGNVFLLETHAEVQGELVGDGPAVLQVEGDAVGGDVAEFAVLPGVGEERIDA